MAQIREGTEMSLESGKYTTLADMQSTTFAFSQNVHDLAKLFNTWIQLDLFLAIRYDNASSARAAACKLPSTPNEQGVEKLCTYVTGVKLPAKTSAEFVHLLDIAVQLRTTVISETNDYHNSQS